MSEEIVLARYKNLTLTNKRLIQEKNGFFSTSEEEFWLSKIDSISYERRIPFWVFALASFTILTIFLVFTIEAVPDMIKPLTIVLGLLILINIIYFLAQKTLVVRTQNPSSQPITSSGRDAEEFLAKLEDAINAITPQETRKEGD